MTLWELFANEAIEPHQPRARNEMTNEFGGSLYHTRGAKIEAMVAEWITAGGANKEGALADILACATDEELVDDMMSEWVPLDATRDELVAHMADFRSHFGKFRLVSVKGRISVDGTLEDAIREAIAYEAKYQPAYGVTIEQYGETVAEVEDGKVTL
jgi:hypothetical protein